VSNNRTKKTNRLIYANGLKSNIEWLCQHFPQSDFYEVLFEIVGASMVNHALSREHLYKIRVASVLSAFMRGIRDEMERNNPGEPTIKLTIKVPGTDKSISITE